MYALCGDEYVGIDSVYSPCQIPTAKAGWLSLLSD